VTYASNGSHCPVVGVDVRSLRVGLDHIGGVGVYTREVVGRILADAGRESPALRLVPFGGFRWASEAGNNLREWAPGSPPVVTSHLPGRVQAMLWRRLAWPPLESLIGRCDLMHGTDHFLPPHRCPKRIYTVHDVIVVSRPDLVLDAHRRFVERQLPAWRREGTRFIAVSEFTRSEMIRLLGLPPESIRVIPNGVGVEFRPPDRAGEGGALDAFRAAHGLSQRFLLGVGNTNPNKNFANLLRAARIVLERTRAVDQLVLCGNQGWPAGPLRREAERLGDRLRLVSLRRADMPRLYGAATVLLFPSLYEGFGLPVLEAMACGTPVVTSQAAALPETAGDAALYCDPGDPEAIAAQTLVLVEDETVRARLVARGRTHAGQFSWGRAAHDTLEVYREALAA
jgi:glycosyltransferase involved in cell wall biosynthesis